MIHDSGKAAAANMYIYAKMHARMHACRCVYTCTDIAFADMSKCSERRTPSLE